MGILDFWFDNIKNLGFLVIVLGPKSKLSPKYLRVKSKLGKSKFELRAGTKILNKF